MRGNWGIPLRKELFRITKQSRLRTLWKSSGKSRARIEITAEGDSGHLRRPSIARIEYHVSKIRWKRSRWVPDCERDLALTNAPSLTFRVLSNSALADAVTSQTHSPRRTASSAQLSLF